VVGAFGLNAISPEDESVSIVRELTVSRHPTEKEMDAYERVLTDALAGDQTLFAREDYIEEAWRIVDPVLQGGTPLHYYEPKTWGPAEAERLAPPGGWHDPVLTANP
jgi:glucose-6-phosphate 1-dehydrogenase